MTKEKETTRQQGADLFVVDNSDVDWKVSRYLKEWNEFANTFDIATGYFEILGKALEEIGHNVINHGKTQNRTKIRGRDP